MSQSSRFYDEILYERYKNEIMSSAATVQEIIRYCRLAPVYYISISGIVGIALQIGLIQLGWTGVESLAVTAVMVATGVSAAVFLYGKYLAQKDKTNRALLAAFQEIIFLENKTADLQEQLKHAKNGCN